MRNHPLNLKDSKKARRERALARLVSTKISANEHGRSVTYTDGQILILRKKLNLV